MNHMFNLHHFTPHHKHMLQQLQWIVGCSILCAGLLILLSKLFMLLH